MKFLNFLNLTSYDKKLSITNLALYTILVKVAISPLDWSSALTLFCVCLNYSHKRHVDSKLTTNLVNENSETISQLKEEVGQIKAAHESVEKLATEAKKLMSNQNLSNGFQRRG